MIEHKQTHCKRGHEFTPENTIIRKTGYWSCKECAKLGDKRRAPRYKERKKRASIKWRQTHPEIANLATKRQHIRRQFGLTLEEYSEKLRSQNNLCELCKTPFEGSVNTKLAPALDHCHVDKKLRGFIHNRCNMAIGMLLDSAKLCRLAAEYLEKHQGEEMYQSKNGNKYGSAYVGKRHDEAFKSYDAGEQPGEANENSHAKPQEAGSSEADVKKLSPAVHTHYQHDHDGGQHTVTKTGEDGTSNQSVYSSAAEAYEKGGVKDWTDVKREDHPPQQSARSEEMGYEQTETA